jgi:2'-5' RNA ligase
VRLFIALTLPDAVRRELSHHVQRERIGFDSTEVRMTEPNRWHITLAFLGNVEETKLPGLIDALSGQPLGSTLDRTPIRLAGGGRFGRSTAWVGVTPGTDWLAALASEVQQRARSARCPVDPDGRPPRWRAHVTVVRARRRAPVGVDAGLVATLKDYQGPWWTPDSATLFRSRLGPQPSHEALATLQFPPTLSRSPPTSSSLSP